MADVTSRTDRAQIILVSGLMIAVTLLVLVLLLNTVIYTENVATRGIDSDIGEAAEFQQTLDEEVAAILAEERRDEEPYVQDNVSRAMQTLFDQQANTSLQRGHIAEASIVSNTTGINISDTPEENSSLAADVNTTRTFEIGLYPDEVSRGEFIEIDVEGESIWMNGTDDGVQMEDEDSILCEYDSNGVVTANIVNGSLHADGDVEACGDLWSDLTDHHDAYDIDVNFSEGIEIESFVYRGWGPDTTSNFEHAEWYVDHVELELTYISSELTYEVSRVIEGAFNS